MKQGKLSTGFILTCFCANEDNVNQTEKLTSAYIHSRVHSLFCKI